MADPPPRSQTPTSHSAKQLARSRQSDTSAAKSKRSKNGFARLIGKAVTTVVENTDVENLVGALDMDALLESIDIETLLDHIDVNAVAARLDLDSIIERLDIDAISERLNIERIVDRLDVNRIAARLDLDAVVARLDIDDVAARLDIESVVKRIDVEAVAARLDLERLVQRLDVNAIADRLDVDRLIDRIDVDQVAARLDMAQVVQRLDVNAVAERLDLDAVMSKVDLAPLIGRGTQEVAESWWNFGRRQVVRADFAVETATARICGREVAGRRNPDGEHQSESDAGFHNHPAGVWTRSLAFAFDLWLAIGVFGIVGSTTNYLWNAVFNHNLDIPGVGWMDTAFLVVWLVCYGFAFVYWFGRTPGHLLLGLKVRATSSSAYAGAVTDVPMTFGTAAIRIVMLVLSIPLGIASLAMIAVRSDRRALHDLGSHSKVVYDWGGRPVLRPAPVLTSIRRPRLADPEDR